MGFLFRRVSPPLLSSKNSVLCHLLLLRSEMVSKSICRLVGVSPDGERLPGTERHGGFFSPLLQPSFGTLISASRV